MGASRWNNLKTGMGLLCQTNRIHTLFQMSSPKGFPLILKFVMLGINPDIIDDTTKLPVQDTPKVEMDTRLPDVPLFTGSPVRCTAMRRYREYYDRKREAYARENPVDDDG